MALVRSLSDHFVRRWRERHGGPVTVATVNRLIASGIQIRSQRRILIERPDGSLIPVKQLAEFWVHRSGVLIRVDLDQRRAVTVITHKRGITGQICGWEYEDNYL